MHCTLFSVCRDDGLCQPQRGETVGGGYQRLAPGRDGIQEALMFLSEPVVALAGDGDVGCCVGAVCLQAVAALLAGTGTKVKLVASVTIIYIWKGTRCIRFYSSESYMVNVGDI